jgi:LysM repeat protein
MPVGGPDDLPVHVTASDSKVPPAPTGASMLRYTVAPGDTVSVLATRYKTTVQAIIDDNHLANPNLIVQNQILSIYPGKYVPNHWSLPAPAQVTYYSAPAVTHYTVTHYSAPVVASSGSGSCYGLDMSNPDVAEIINHESHCDPSAHNGQYCGIGQDANECGLSGPAQAQAMTSYVMSRYGSWSAAAAHERAYGWY